MGGSGGGAVRIEASGTVTVNGSISANGEASKGYIGAGGSGGSVYLTCGAFGGTTTGVVRANGGNGWSDHYSAGGGGGRIALDCTGISPTCAVQIAAAPATDEYATVDPTNRWMHAAKTGTLWLPGIAEGRTLIANGQLQGVNVTISGVSSLAFDSLTVAGSDFGFVDTAFDLTVSNALTVGAGGALTLGAYHGGAGVCTLTCGSLVLTNGGSLTLYSGTTNSPAQTNGFLLAVANDVTIGASSWLTPRCHPTNGATPLLTMAGLTIEAGGGINAVGSGYQWGRGPGAPLPGSTYAGGGGYGGKGGGGADPWFGGVTYGSLTAPTHPGSSGQAHSSTPHSSGWGGGSVRIQAAGTVTLRGTIVADGSDGLFLYGSPGSGGSICLGAFNA